MLVPPLPIWGQTAATGQIVGIVSDPSGAVIGGATVTVKSADTGITRSVTSNETGSYTVPLLPPGKYSVTVSEPGFKTTTSTDTAVPAATSTTVNLTLEVGDITQEVMVEAAAEVLQTENASSGGTVNEVTVAALPLTNRNYTQILGLSPGVASQVPNAATLGRNTVNVNVNGGLVSDNSFQMDGQDVSNLQSQGGGDTVALGGISVPSPDAIEEFRVQTSQYDATYGRGSGANVNVVTKSGTNTIHGGAFEFVRNNILNANDFFLNRNGQPRPILKQNQFGGTLGGPLVKDKLFVFGSYQGTRQVIGLGSGSLQSVVLPPLTDDRSAQTLGRIFCGQSGANGGVGVACDGSNVNPVALKLLNARLPDGTYVIPTPQVIQRNSQGFSVFSVPSTFRENQILVNGDYLKSEHHHIAIRTFWSRDPQLQSFTSSNVPGAALDQLFGNSNIALKDTYTITPTLINEASAGFHRIYGRIQSQYPVKDADIGLPTPCTNPIAPIMTVTGSFILGGNGNDGQYADTKQFSVQEQVSWVRHSHNIRMGGTAEKNMLPFADPNLLRGSMTFNSFPDFLLGMSAAQNGSSFSNVFSSSSTCGDTGHRLRVNDYALYFQDDYKVKQRLSLNLGVRWDIYGQSSDVNGRLVNFWPELASNTFPASGQTYSGFVVPSNFKTPIPDGVLRNSNTTFAAKATAWGSIGPRIGISWQPEFTNRLVLRGGYGLYFARTSVNDAYQQCCNVPFVNRVNLSGVTNAAATFQQPWGPNPIPITLDPVWPPRTPTSLLSLSTIDPHWSPPMLNQWSLNVQVELTRSMMLQTGYVGNSGSRIELSQNINQPYLASPSNPINGITVNTLANAPQRVPIAGFSSLTQRSFIGESAYHGLQMSLQQNMAHGASFQLSYTFSKAMTDLVGYGVFPSTGSLYNNAHSPQNSWGGADYNVPQRFIAHFVWDVPEIKQGGAILNKVVSGWTASGVVTLQIGQPLTFTDNRSGTIYGTSAQLSEICPGFSYTDILTPGRLKDNLDNYFNPKAFCAPVSYGSGSSIGYGFGNMGRGVIYGPGQHNTDVQVTRRFKTPGAENSHFELRGEFYNAFNSAQFQTVSLVQGATPITRVGVANFGHIGATSVAPRLIQLGLKYLF
jgi:hypothetical protein